VKLSATTLALAALALGLASGCKSVQPTDELRMHANESFAREEYKRAIAFDTEILRREPNDLQATMQRGVAYDRLGNVPDAQADFTRAIELNPDAPAPRLYRANLALKTGQPAAAAPDIAALKGLELETAEQVQSLVLEGVMHMGTRDWMAALRPLRQAIDASRGDGDPNTARAYRDALHNASECYYRLGGFEQATSLYDELLLAQSRADEPVTEDDRYALGVLTYLKGDFARSRQVFAQVSPARRKEAAKLLQDEGFFASAR
jgi:tetratricopeptide (TPR) repeat protein